MKILTLFILFITILPFAQGALIQDILDDSGNLQEIITLNSTIKVIDLPKNSNNVQVLGTEYSLNNTRLSLVSCLNTCTISFTLEDVIVKENTGLSFSRNLKAFEPSTYEIHLPIGSIIDINDNTIVPKPEEVNSDGKSINIIWNINDTTIQRYYVLYTDHEDTEGYIQEIKGEFSEWSVITITITLMIISFLVGYFLRKDNEVSVVSEQLLNADEKLLLQEINKHHDTSSKILTQKDLGKQLSWSKSKVSGVMSSLVQKKLVEKEKIGRNHSVKPLTKISTK